MGDEIEHITILVSGRICWSSRRLHEDLSQSESVRIAVPRDATIDRLQLSEFKHIRIHDFNREQLATPLHWIITIGVQNAT
jgi:hypothetical protein